MPQVQPRTGLAQRPGGTLLGIFNPQSPESVKALGAQAIRLLISGRALGHDGPEIAARLSDYRRLGLTVIVTISHWNGEKKAPLAALDSEECRQLLDQFEGFLRAAGSAIDYCAIDNEPMFDLAPADLARRGTGPAPAIAWYLALAKRAKLVINSDPRLSGIRVSAPALNDVHRQAEGKRTQSELIDMFLDWEINDPNIDALDIHLHVAAVRDVDDALAFMNRKTTKPLLVTEWSQAGAVREWLGTGLDSGFARKWKLGPQLTNRGFIQACYDKPVEKSEWDEFVGKAPYDSAFMRNAFAAMLRHNVAVAAYGAQKQYGNTAFDSKQLLANLTVVPGPNGDPQENFQFAAWYRDLAEAYAAGTLDPDKPRKR
jgi:hypothetical protein